MIFKKALPLLVILCALASAILHAQGAESLQPSFHQPGRTHNKQQELINAVVAGDLSYVKSLINIHEVDKNTKDIVDKNSLLHLAIQNQKKDIFDFLLSANANTDIQNKYGETPLHIAALMGNKYYIDELLKEGSTNVNTQDIDANTVFHKVVQLSKLEYIASFIDLKNFDHTLRNANKMTILDMLNKIKITDVTDDSSKTLIINAKDCIRRFANIIVKDILKEKIYASRDVKKLAEETIKSNKKFFLSYAWSKEYETTPMVDDFENFINKKLGITNYYRDRRREEGLGITRGTYIDSFMRNAQEADVVVIFLNDAYLKSRNCMYEFLQVWNEQKKTISFKAFIVANPDFVSSFFEDPNTPAAPYYNHWNAKYLNSRTRDMNTSSLKDRLRVHQKEDFILNVLDNITPLINELSDRMHLQNYKELRLKCFEDIFCVALDKKSYTNREEHIYANF